jgi:hypothetical protein
MRRFCQYSTVFFLVWAHMAPMVWGETKVDGSIEFGVWYLRNNVSDFEEDGVAYTAQDGYGNTYVQDDYSLLHTRLKLHTGDDKSAMRFHTKGRFLFNLQERNLSIGINERYRYQFDELNIEWAKLFKNTSLFVGRKSNWQTGGIGVDGLTAVISPKDPLEIGLYAGLGVDPRQFTGYIGPNFREEFINPDFQTGGAFASWRNERLQFNVAVNSLLFEMEIDRINVFTQALYRLNDRWRFSGLVDAGVAGDPGLQQLQLFVQTQLSPKITNDLSYYRYQSIFFAASDASGISVPTDINPNFDLGDEVQNTYYRRISNHTKFKLKKNYFFTRFSHTYREFDQRTRKDYVIGYRDPEIGNSEVDMTIKTTIIDNFRSFHTNFDLLLGFDVIASQLRMELGGTLSANEREVFEDFAPTDRVQRDQEGVGRVNLIYQPSLKIAWYLMYAYYKQVDAVNLDQTVNLHEVYLSTNVRF